MLFTVYEKACVVADFEKVDLKELAREAFLPLVSTPVMQRNINTYLLKIGLVKDKQAALDNLMLNIDKFTTSNESIIKEASLVSGKALSMRINLEISVLESQLKMLEIELVGIQPMTSDEFIAKYGV